MPAVRAHSSLALNRELNGIDKWDETTIAERGASLFDIARKIWIAPKRDDATKWVLADEWRKGQRTAPNPSNIYSRPGSQYILLLLSQRGAFSESLGVDREWLDGQLIDKVEGVHNKQAVSFAIMELRDEKGKIDSQGGKNSDRPIGRVWLLETPEENDADRSTTVEMQHFWEAFLNDLKLDDPEQPIPSPARQGYLSFMLPAQSGSSWLTVYRSMKRGEVGVTLSSHRDTAGDYARQAIVDEWDEVKDQLGGTAKLIEENGRSLIRDSHIFGALDQPEVRAKAFAWLAGRVNTFVNVMRPRVRSAAADFC